ncbi:HNH endonuclease [Aestuariibacter halophilus]|uniref:HNH endonuclease n=1 Tax=Fluctibacter halophilus TaxID=226011 RepID=A0ABS8G9Y2_9ALTE|nr:HNH endonuclease signature motif containing protein [Aestuariibacter halophilus]MCC2616524.1 HNH endonuclease [Aestuariibacter halophilus]
MSKVKVIFRMKDSEYTRSYQSPRVAFREVYKYLEGADSDPFRMAMYCDPDDLPRTFHKAIDVPYNPLKKKTKAGFYNSQAWRKLRMEALDFYGRRCVACGASARYGADLHVDHIKPRSKYPDLELELDNLQILCENCNRGKMADYEEDWR